MHLTLLGGFGARIGQRDVSETAFPRRKAANLLKLLAIQPEYRLHRDHVLEYLWPDLNSESASAQLYKAVHHIRQAFASVAPDEPVDALLQVSGDLIRLSAPAGITTDARNFQELAGQALATRELEQLEQAVSRYSGDLLPAELYEPWTEELRDALRERYVDLLVNLGECYLAIGSLARAADSLRAAISRDNAREDAHRALMLVYARQGNRARAVRQYQHCVEAMRQELDVDVSTRTSALYQQILDEKVPHLAQSGPSPAIELNSLSPLAGRRPELRVISDLLNQLGQGKGSVLALEGAAGAGKTRLTQEILRQGWQHRWHVLYGSTHEQEGQVPYMPLIEALRMAVWADPTDAHLIPAELAVAIPEIPASATTIATSDRLAAQSALFAGVSRFLAARARTAPVILILEDLHAIDDGSLKLFHYLAREAADSSRGTDSTLPLLLVGTWRPLESGATSALEDVISNLERQGVLHKLPVGPLSEREHRTVLEQALDGGPVDPRVASELYRHTEGNALFAREMARQLAADGRLHRPGRTWQFTDEVSVAGLSTSLPIPSSLETLARRKVESLSAAARHTVQLAAAIGQNVPFGLLEHCLRTGEVVQDTSVDVLDELVAAGLLAEAGLDLRFPHPLLREAIYDRLSRVRRHALHADVASTLETLHGNSPESMPVESVAYHFQHAGNVERAVYYLIQAGERARAVYDHDGAISRYTEAQRLIDDQPTTELKPSLVEIYERIGDTYRDIGDVTRSFQMYQQALALLEAHDSPDAPERLFELHRKITLGAILTANMPLAAEHLSHAREFVSPDHSDIARLRITESLFDWHTLQFDASVQHAREALHLAEPANAPVEINQAYEMLALSHMALGKWDEALEYEMKRNSADWSPNITVAIDAHLCLYQYKLHSEESLQEARRFIDSVAQQADDTGNQRCLAVCQFVLGNLAMLQGMPATAARAINHALHLHNRIDSPSGVAYTLAAKAELLSAAGVHDAVPSLIQEGLVASERAAIHDHCVSQLYTAGIRNSLAAGDEIAVAEVVEAARRHDMESPPCAVCQVDMYEAIAAVHIEFGEPELAEPLITQAMQLAEQAMNLPGRARLIRLQARVHLAHGRIVEAERCLTEAMSIFRNVGDQYDLARTLLIVADVDGQDRAALQEQANEILGRYCSSSTLASLRA